MSVIWVVLVEDALRILEIVDDVDGESARTQLFVLYELLICRVFSKTLELDEYHRPEVMQTQAVGNGSMRGRRVLSAFPSGFAAISARLLLDFLFEWAFVATLFDERHRV